MNLRQVAGGMMALLASGLAHPGSAQQRFRAGVDLISLSVTVTNPAHGYVVDLERGDFEVLEDGVRQQLAFFGKTNVPLALALLLDTSASMEQSLTTAHEAAVGFIKQLQPTDVAAALDFDSRVDIVQGFTSDKSALELAIRGTTAGGSTSLYNALYIALKELNKVGKPDPPHVARRRAIVLLSDGDDTSSLIGFEEVLDLASRSDTVIYAIGLGIRDRTGRVTTQEAPFVLRRLAQQTGGRAFFPMDARELAGVYRDIREELASQYSLAYESTTQRKSGGWQRITVRVARPGVAVRTRQGYYAQPN